MSHDLAGVPISEAAARLGVSENAVRKRIRRKSLPAYKVDDRWYVVLDGLASDQAGDQVMATSPDQAAARPAGQGNHDRELIDQLRSEVVFLRGQIEVKDREIEEWMRQAQQQRLMIARLESQLLELLPGVPESPESVPEPQHDPQDIGPVYRVLEPPTRPWWKFC
jgi:transposase